MDWNNVIAMINEQNLNPDTTAGQREANALRLYWIDVFSRTEEKSEPLASTDFILERLNDPNYCCSPNILLDK